MEIVTPRWVYCVSAGQDEVGKWKAHDVAGAWCISYLHTAALRAKCRPDSESDVFQDRATLPQLNFHHAGSQDQRSLAFGYSGPKWCPVLLRVSGGTQGRTTPAPARRGAGSLQIHGDRILGGCQPANCIELHDQHRQNRRSLTAHPRHPWLNLNGSRVRLGASPTGPVQTNCVEPPDQTPPRPSVNSFLL